MNGSDLHLRVGEPPILRKHGEMVRIEGEATLDQFARSRPCSSTRSCRSATRRSSPSTADTDFAYEIAGPRPLPRQRAQGPQGDGGGVPRDPERIVTADQLGLSQEVQNLCYLTKGLVLVTGPDRVRQVDDALRADRPGQPLAVRSRHHDRGPDRVRAREQELHHHAAAGGRAHRLVQERAARRAARGPGHHPRRRAARPRDGRHRDRDGGDRPPRVRHAAHDDRGEHDRPPHRPVPGRPAGADPHDALRVAQGRHLAGAVQEDRRRARGGPRDPARHAGHQRTSSARGRRSRSRASCRRPSASG